MVLYARKGLEGELTKAQVSAMEGYGGNPERDVGRGEQS